MYNSIYFYAVLVLGAFAIFDLVVGVSNDAVNFLNPAIGSRVSSRKMILIFATVGILAGVTFSSGMMEVARKGIFHPQFFNMPDLLVIFLAVMMTDIILLDTFSSMGLPTSTTVSVVFELLGSAVAVSCLKIFRAGHSMTELGSYINTTRALMIIGGIFFAVVVAFVTGVIIQFISRFIFSFNYEKTMRRYGAVWGGIAMATVTYFILIKGAKGASFMTADTLAWIQNNTLLILAVISVISAIILEIWILLGFNVFKPVVLIGTFAIAMAFAANDLVNFIGVPLAGWNSFQAAAATSDPLHASMSALAGKVPADTYLLLLAGAIMACTLWFSKKAQTVIETGVGLSAQDEGVEHFGASFLSRIIVQSGLNVFGTIRAVTPPFIRSAVQRRFDVRRFRANADDDNQSSFDLLRAAVNIMVASALISYGTAHKLPLSTTYVTFMVAMGASLADRAWGRESAVYRVTGVLTVIGGWLLTALIAFTAAGCVATAIYYGGTVAVVVLLILIVVILKKNHGRHARRMEAEKSAAIFNLKKVTDIRSSVATTFDNIAFMLDKITHSVDKTSNALFDNNVYVLRGEKDEVQKIRQWTNIIIANAFKSLRLLQIKENGAQERNYLQVVRRLQKISDGYADITLRAYEHVANHHKGLLESQKRDLRELKTLFVDFMCDVQKYIAAEKPSDIEDMRKKKEALKTMSNEIQHKQLDRIKSGEAKTRLSIMFFALAGNLYMLTNQVFYLLQILQDSFHNIESNSDAYEE